MCKMNVNFISLQPVPDPINIFSALIYATLIMKHSDRLKISSSQSDCLKSRRSLNLHHNVFIGLTPVLSNFQGCQTLPISIFFLVL